MYIDIHSHILPNVDDGSKSISESLRMLEMLKKQGVDTVTLTPHFYPAAELTVSEYKERVLSSYNRLKEAASGICENLFLGSEVYLFHGIATFSDIRELCINSSEYILVELPYRRISSRTVDDIIELNLSRGLTPILAHIERYSRFENYERLLSLISDGYALGQINAYSLLHFKTRRTACKLIKDGYVHLIASDAHSADENPPRIGEGLHFVEKKLGRSYAERLKSNCDNIYNKILKGSE